MGEWASSTIFVDALERLDWERRRLDERASEWEHIRPRQRAKQDKMSRAERAFCFVFVAGVLEDLFRTLDQSAADDIQLLELTTHKMRPAALAMLFPKAWESTSSDRVIRMVKRAELVQAANDFYASSEAVDFSGVTRLGIADGRTVNAHHFEAVWEGLCLSAASESIWVTPAHRIAVVTIANKRNAIAHFETDPREEAFRSSYRELSQLVGRVSETVERLQEGLLVWLDTHSKA